MAESRKVQVSLRLLMATMTVVAVAFAVGRASVPSGVAVGCTWGAAVLVWKSCYRKIDYLCWSIVFVALFCANAAFVTPSRDLPSYMQGGLRSSVDYEHGIPQPWFVTRIGYVYEEPFELMPVPLFLAVSATAMVAAMLFAIWQFAHANNPFPWNFQHIVGLVVIAVIAIVAGATPDEIYTDPGVAALVASWPLAVEWGLIAAVVLVVSLKIARVDYALLAASTAVVTLATCLGIDLTKDPGLLLIKWLSLFGICFFPSLLAIDAIKLRKSDHWKQDVTP